LDRLRLRLQTDEELIAELVEGESDALTVLFERHSPLVFRIAHRVLRNDADAEDAVQQVFLDVFRAATQLEPQKGSFKSWLLQFAYHRSFNSRRQLRARGYYDSDSIEDLLPKELLEGANHAFPISSTDVLILVDQVLKLVEQGRPGSALRTVPGSLPRIRRRGVRSFCFRQSPRFSPFQFRLAQLSCFRGICPSLEGSFLNEVAPALMPI
jgi:RNA polymerase sigma factor (sigma-70 family)